MEVTASMVKDLREKTGAGMMDCKKALAETNGDMNAAVDWLREKGIAKSEKKAARIAAEGLANIYTNNNRAVIIEVNSETDFVSKNEEFTGMIDTIGNTILNSSIKTLEEALELQTEEGTINDLIIAKTAKIGEKLSLRRIEVIEKSDDEVFGSYLHMGGKIAVLTVLKGANEAVAKDVAMQSAAMKPVYVFEADIPEEVIAHERSIQKEIAMGEGKPAEIAEKMVEGRIKKHFKEICLAEQPFIKDGDINVATYVKNNNGEIKTMIRYEVGEGMEKRSENFAEEVMNQIKGN
ncbi:MAG: elongation factor Ts [Bacilli bacterium]|jgi:elongation factor Ts|nr:elongation factor Ts [Bacilli bacterium]MCX4254042.1 translation elongation factor Ts [Bacilli bacterium]